MSFKRGNVVCIRDYPFGRCINAQGVVLARLKDDFYNVKLISGLSEGKIIKYKYWLLEYTGKDSNI